MAIKMQSAPTPVISNSNYISVQSPHYVTLPITSSENQIRLMLWVWGGALTKPFDDEDEPTVVLYKTPVSIEDNSVWFELSDYIKSRFDPKYSHKDRQQFNTGVFFKYEWVEVPNTDTNEEPSEPIASGVGQTCIATQGHLWDFRTMVQGLDAVHSFGKDYEVNSQYIIEAKNFINPFIFSQTTIDASFPILQYNPQESFLVCPKEKYTIIYLDRNGLWKSFAPTGKIVINESIEREKYFNLRRVPMEHNRELDHRITQFNRDVQTEYIVGTGIIKPNQVQIIEDIIYSYKVYLIEFIQNLMVGDDLPLEPFTVYQYPVIVTDTDFVRKTRLNDKNKIKYNIKLAKTTNKLSDIR